MSEATLVQIDVVSDVICPWCYIGKRRLEQARRLVAPTVETRVRWRPYQLDPTVPKDGIDRDTYLERKFGNAEKVRHIYGQIVDAGRADGIDFAFPAISRTPNTFDAHRVISWAWNEGPDVQDAVVEQLFRMFFLEGRDLGDSAVLSEAADAGGMDRSIMASLLATDRDSGSVQTEIATARQMGITGVPCFIINKTFAVMGAQAPEEIAAAIRQAATGSA